MGRVAEPLRLMGASIEGDRPPLHVCGGELMGIDYTSPVASAQIKSAVLLAGLRAKGQTFVREPAPSRDHTERMLTALNVPLIRDERRGTGVSACEFDGFEFRVPADISSAAFWMVAAACIPESEVELLDVGVNPTRTGVLDVLSQVGVPWYQGDERDELGEPMANLVVRPDLTLQPFAISGALVPRLIDEIPILGVLATQCDGVSVIRDAGELRVKESDRIEAMAAGLRAMGAVVDTFDDGMAVHGPVALKAATVDAGGDHRIAMAFAIAGVLAEGETRITGAESILTSYPEFERHLWRLAVV
jgi:3-phosphoshikimate 1-carboxyvinyltransferase